MDRRATRAEIQHRTAQRHRMRTRLHRELLRPYDRIARERRSCDAKPPLHELCLVDRHQTSTCTVGPRFRRTSAMCQPYWSAAHA